MTKVLFTLPPVSRYPSRREWEKACWKKLIDSPELFERLATPKERSIFVLRAAATSRINEGKKYRQIAEELWLSPQTISAIRKSVRERAYRSYRERGKTERKRKMDGGRVFRTERGLRGRPVRTKYGMVYMP